MSVEINVTGEVVTARLIGELDHHTAKGMREAIDNAVDLNMPSLLVLDFGAVTFMDSSGIGLVMGRFKLIKDLGGRLAIENAPKSIRKVMRMAGIEKLIEKEKEGNFI